MRPSPYLSLRIRAHLSRSRHDAVSPSAPVQKPIEAAYYRGGTSRAVILQPHHLPRDRARWPAIFRQLMGSGDPYGRQLDGMGAGISSLSKICLVEPFGQRNLRLEGAPRFRTGFGGIDAARESARAAEAQEEAQKRGDEQELDIDYTFVGLGIESDEVDVAGNCGNMSSAIGPYAYNARLLPSRFYANGDGEVTVKIRNTNTGKLINSTFEVVGGQAAVVGDYTIDGVTGAGSKIKLDFKHPYGSKTGKVLPTGKKVDNIAGYKVSCVDGANPAVFIRADDIGVDGTILPHDFNKLSDKLTLLENIRKSAAVAMGIAPTANLVPRTIPKIGLVSQSSSHPVLSGQLLTSSQMDIVIRFLSDTQPHRAIPLTAALTTAVAARISGTIVEQMLAPEPLMDGAITIGHASGRLQVNATMDKTDTNIPVSATVYRTAKRIFEGEIFWNDKKQEESDAGAVYGSNGRHSLGMAFVLENRGKSSEHLSVNDGQGDRQEATKRDAEPTQTEVLETQEQEQVHGTKVEQVDGKPSHNAQFDTIASVHEATPLTSTLFRLRSRLTNLLHDQSFTDNSYPPDLSDALKDALRQLATDSNTRIQPGRGQEWHKWARTMHKQSTLNRYIGRKRAVLESNKQTGRKSMARRKVAFTKSEMLVAKDDIKFGRPRTEGRFWNEREKRWMNRGAVTRDERTRNDGSWSQFLP